MTELGLAFFCVPPGTIVTRPQLDDFQTLLVAAYGEQSLALREQAYQVAEINQMVHIILPEN